MKRNIWICMLVILTAFTATAEQAKPGMDIRYTVQPFHYLVDGKSYAHPQKLSAVQVSRILSVIHIELDFGRHTPVLDAEERMQLAPKIAELFSRLKPDQQIEVKKIVTRTTTDGTRETVRSKTLYLCFLEPDTMYAAYVSSGTDLGSTLKKGYHMEKKLRDDGSVVPNILFLKRPLWTDNFMKPAFPEAEERIKNLANIQGQATKPEPGNAEKAAPATGTMTLDQLESELARLRSMLDRKLIDDKEYQRLRKMLFQKAGI